MASLTIEQLKKSLIEQGIALPPAGSKKADYVRLYEQYSTLNENLGDYYSSDDENPPRNSSQSVSSSSSPSKIESIIREVERLTDDELYNQLKELGASIGPVLKNTRKVYEKKLIKLLGRGNQTNGLDSINTRKTNTYKVDEFSDSEVDLPSVRASYRKSEQRDTYMGRTSSITRDSPKPSMEEPAVEPPAEKKYASYNFSEVDTKRPSFGNFSSENVSSRSKFSFIETIPKGSTQRYIEPTSEVDYPATTYRSRFSSEKSNFGSDEYYTGSWQPNVKKYLGQQQLQQQKMPKITKKTLGFNTKSTYKENILAVLIVLAFILLVLYLYFYQWSTVDPYKEIQDDAERVLEDLTSQKGDK